MLEIVVKDTTERCIEWIRKWFKDNGNNCNAIIGMSGGKDSTIVAALVAKAIGPERVIGVSMPDKGQGENGAKEICEYLGIHYMVYPIDKITEAYRNSHNYDYNGVNGEKLVYDNEWNIMAEQNIPPRVRMTTLYAIAQNHNGRVINTCNKSEDYIGYSTKFGDSAGDMSPFANLTVTEILCIGDYLGIPYEWVHKTPDDGLPNSCPDEEKFGFTYEMLDCYLMGGKNLSGINDETYEKIERMHRNNLHKLLPMPCFKP